MTLETALADAEVFDDGDWVESKDQDPDGDVRLIQLADVGDGTFINKSDRYLTSSKAATLRCTFLKAGDVLIARMPDPLGRACTFPGDLKPAVTVVDVCIIRPEPVQMDARWLMHCLNGPQCRNQIYGFATGTTRPRISRGNLKKVEIPVPPLTDQRRIARILDNAEALRAKRREAIEKLAALPEQLFFDMFSVGTPGRDRPPSQSLGDYLVFVTSGSRGWAEFYAPVGTRFIRSLDVQMNQIGDDDVTFVVAPDTAEARRTRARVGDVLLTITGSRIGRVSPLPPDLDGSYVSQHVAILRPDHHRLDPSFLSFYLSFGRGGQRQIAQSQYGQTKPGLNFEQIRRFQIPVPSLKLQREFARRVHAVERLRNAQRASLAELDALFASLQHRAFRGEL